MTWITESKTAACTLRTARPGDEEFLFQLFADTQEHLAVFRPNPVLYQSLVATQYKGREMSYAAEYPEAMNAILCVEGEERSALPVGRILVDCKPGCWRIVDIALLAAHRGRGLGSWALRTCQRQSEAAGARLTLAVRPEKRARRLYERLGFRATREDALAVEMELATPFPHAADS